MTGMDVLRRCRGYDSDMKRLYLQSVCAQDILTKITRSTTSTGHGSVEDKMGLYIARKDAVERAMQARREMYKMELDESARLVAQMEPDQGTVMHMRLVRGLTMRQTAAEMHTQEGCVKGLYRRGQARLYAMESDLDHRTDYKRLMAIYRDA